MSVVTNVVLAYGLCLADDDFQLLAEVNRCIPYVASPGLSLPRLVHVEDKGLPECWFCNGKTLEVNLAVGAFNYLDVDRWLLALESVDFAEFDCGFAQFMVMGQEDFGFRILEIWRG